MSNEELQALFGEFQELNQGLQQIEKQLSLIANQVVELTVSKQYLEDLHKVKEGTPILVPISNGIYAKASLLDNEQLIVNIGANTMLPKTKSEAQSLIDSQITELREMQAALSEEMKENAEKAVALENEMRILAANK